MSDQFNFINNGFGTTALQLARKILAEHGDDRRPDNAQNSDGQNLREYLYYHRVLTLFAQTLIAEQSIKDDGENPGVTQIKREVPSLEYADRLRLAQGRIKPDDVISLSETTAQIAGYRGKLHPIHLLHISCVDADKNCWIARADIDYEGGKLISYRDPVFIRQNTRGHYAHTSSGIKVDDAITFGDHQLFALIAIENALLSNKKDQAVVFATGTGKSYILLAPAIATGKGGIFCVPNSAQRDQLINDILTLDTSVTRSDIMTNDDVAPGDEAATMLKHCEGRPKYIILEHSDIHRFSTADVTNAYKKYPEYKELTPQHLEDRIRKIPYFIDEAHEVIPGAMAQLLDRGNRVLAVTATWTNDLQKLFGDPMAQLDMHYALNELRAFRPIITNLHQFKPGQSSDDQVFEIIADYYGRVAFVDGDNTPESREKYITYAGVKKRPHLLDGGYEQLVEKIMATTEIRRFDYMNMAFTKNYPLMVALKDALQAISEGNYARMPQLAARISQRRAQARVGQLWAVENEMFGITSPAHNVPLEINLNDPRIAARFKNIIAKSAIDPDSLKKETHCALKSHIADVMTRRIAGLFLNDTPPGLVRADQISGKLQQKLSELSRPAYGIDHEQKALLEKLALGDSGDIFRRITEVVMPLRPGVRDDILGHLKNGNVSALLIRPDDIDLAGFPAASYAVLVEPGDDQGAAAIARRLNEGAINHVVGDSELATGYSNPDIKSVQRIVYNTIPLGVIRATQTLGRSIRGKDGLAFVTDYVSSEIDMSAPLGGAGGRPFMFSDVMASDYAGRVSQYSRAFEAFTLG